MHYYTIFIIIKGAYPFSFLGNDMRSIIFPMDTIDSKNDIDHGIIGELIANYILVSTRTSRSRGTVSDMGIRSEIRWRKRRGSMGIRIGMIWW